jgi:hypothetical protein
MQRTIQESGLEVQKIYREVMDGSMSKEHTVRCQSPCGCPDFKEVDTVLLSKSLSNESRLVSFNRTIRAQFIREDPAEVNRVLSRGKLHKLIHPFALQGCEFFSHGSHPGVNIGPSIGLSKRAGSLPLPTRSGSSRQGFCMAIS